MYEYIDAYFTIHRFGFSKHLSEGYFEYCMPFAIIKFITKLRAQIALTDLSLWFCYLLNINTAKRKFCFEDINACIFLKRKYIEFY